MVTISELVSMISKIANKTISTESIDGPVGVAKRCSDNTLLKQKLNWSPPGENLEYGLEQTYHWIADELQKN
jgi:UDP-glucose 4-epimerase